MVLVFVAIGVVAGILSGLFGGGGILIVPALMFFAPFHLIHDDRRRTVVAQARRTVS
jgi:uncharacterized membrane protein YfcA